MNTPLKECNYPQSIAGCHAEIERLQAALNRAEYFGGAMAWMIPPEKRVGEIQEAAKRYEEAVTRLSEAESSEVYQRWSAACRDLSAAHAELTKEREYAQRLTDTASSLRKAAAQLLYDVASSMDISHEWKREVREALVRALHDFDAVAGLPKVLGGSGDNAKQVEQQHSQYSGNTDRLIAQLREIEKRPGDLWEREVARAAREAIEPSTRSAEDEIVITIRVKSRIQHTAAMPKLKALLIAINKVAEELAEFAAVRLVNPPEKVNEIGKVPEFPPDTNAERVKVLNDLAAWLRRFAEDFAAGSDPGVNLRVAADIIVAQSEDYYDATRVTDEMVNRFLSWKLPDDFAPDAGITFEPSRDWPIGTNLFTAQQARAMLEHVLAI